MDTEQKRYKLMTTEEKKEYHRQKTKQYQIDNREKVKNYMREYNKKRRALLPKKERKKGMTPEEKKLYHREYMRKYKHRYKKAAQPIIVSFAKEKINNVVVQAKKARICQRCPNPVGTKSYFYCANHDYTTRSFNEN